MFKTERKVYFNVKRVVQKNNRVIQKKLLFKTHFYFSKNISQNNNDLNKNISLQKKVKRFRVIYVKKTLRNKNKKINKNNNPITGRWTSREHKQFLEGLNSYGDNWKKINDIIQTRSPNQIISHAQKFYLKFKYIKDEKLGIDFTLNKINNINDMIKHIRLVNNNHNVIKTFLNLDKKYSKILKRKSRNTFEKQLIIEIEEYSGSDIDNEVINNFKTDTNE